MDRADSEATETVGEPEILALVGRSLAELRGQSLEELVEDLGRAGHTISQRDLRMLLIENPALFEQRRGLWRIRTDSPPQPRSTPTSRPPTGLAPSRPVVGVGAGKSLAGWRSGPGEVERNLRDQLAGRRLIAEVGLNALTLEEVRAAMEEVLSHGERPHDVQTHYPALLTTYLVGHGIYHYDGGEFWTTLDIEGLDSTPWRQAFEHSLRALNVETFEDMVFGDHGLRYVAPILAHGGIPRSALDAYFRLIHRFLRQAGSAAEMLALWRTRKAPFAGIGKPVRRFLLYGGDLSVDFIDRTIDMFREYSRSGVIPKPAEVGLPPYVPLAFRRYVDREHVSRDSIAKRASGVQPSIRLDPWSGSGLVLELPMLTSAADDWAWRLQEDGRIERLAASRFRDREVVLRPARGWSVSLIDGESTRMEAVFEGLDELTALFFDPKDGRLVRPSGGLRLDQAWVLLPQGAEIEGVSADGSITPLRVVEELPEPTQAWSGFRLVAVELRGVRSVEVRSDKQKPWRRVIVRAAAERPSLVGVPLVDTRSGSGYPVHSVAPSLRLPPGEWTVRTLVDGNPRPVELIEAPESSVHDLEVPEGVHEIELSARGPLGADLRARFVVCPGLRIVRPDRVLMPGDPGACVILGSASLSINSREPGATVEVQVPDLGDEVKCLVGDGDGRTSVVLVRVAKLLWGVAAGSHDSLELSDKPASVVEDELTGAVPASLVVRTGTPDLPLRLALSNGRTVLQESDRAVARGEGGRWVFDLGRFSDAVVRTDTATLAFELTVGQVPVTVVHLRRTLDLSDLQVTSHLVDGFGVVELVFQEGRLLADRVARLWPLTRPWDGPVEEPIPDEQRGRASVRGHGRIRPGSYLVEVNVAGDWTTPVRPAVGAPGVQVIQVGTPDDLAGLLDEQAIDPFDRLEFAIVTGRFEEDFDEGDWQKAGPAAVDAAAQIALGQVPRIGTDWKGFFALRWLLSRNPSELASAMVDCAETGRLGPEAALALSVELAGHLRRREAAAVPSSTSRALWGVSPVVATALELADPTDPERAARIDEFTGWNPLECTVPPTGEPVSQLYLGMPVDQMAEFRRHLDLIPGRVLGLDELVAAQLEWLVAEKQAPGTARQWWYDNRRLARTAIDFSDLAERHLLARRPPPGTEDWAAVPHLTLFASLVVVLDLDIAPAAARVLQDAARFAPRLVTRDLVLAQVITAMTSLAALEGVEP